MCVFGAVCRRCALGAMTAPARRASNRGPEAADEELEEAKRAAELAAFAGLRNVWSKASGGDRTTEEEAGGGGVGQGPLCPLSLERVASAEELEAFGLDVLKRELQRRGMKCSGSLRQRAERLFLAKGVDPSALPRTVLARPTNSSRGGCVQRGAGTASTRSPTERRRPTQGPLLPTQRRRPGQLALPGQAKRRRVADASRDPVAQRFLASRMP